MSTPDHPEKLPRDASPSDADPISLALKEETGAPSLPSPPETESSANPPPESPIASIQAHKTRPAPTPPSSQHDTREDQPDKAKGGKGPSDGEEEPQAANAQTPDLAGSPLQEATLASWAGLSDQERKDCYDQIELYFHNLLEDFRTNANEAVVSYSRFGQLGNRWRIWLICLTGGLAVLNVLATSWSDKWLRGSDIRAVFSFGAAIYAVVLALLTNIESFCNFSDKKTSTRESRELYLDAYREFEMLRLTHVYPYGYSAQACVNFVEIYRRLVVKDLELRRKIMQLSTTTSTDKGKG